MKKKLLQVQMGQKIAEIRKSKGLSQEDLAIGIEISRSSLTQIELGNRNIDFLELQKMSLVLGFSLDSFLSPALKVNETTFVEESNEIPYGNRISTPTLQVDKLKNVLLYLLERCAGRPNIGETVLYKLLYFIDFNYYELYEEHLTGATYRKLPYGPVPHKLDAIMAQMIENDELKRIKVSYFNKTQTRYLPLKSANLKALNGAEKDVIDKVIELYGDWSASAISEYSHKDMPWIASKDGQEINYELAFYREAPFSFRNYNNEMEDHDF